MYFTAKHAIENTALRLVGSDYRADYKVVGGEKVYATEFKKINIDNSIGGQLREAGNALVDIASIPMSASGNPAGLLAKTGAKAEATTVAKEALIDLKISDIKSALKEVYKELGIDKALPKGEKGKFGSPTAGDTKKGYRLDPAHPDRPKGDKESVPHINFWDWTGGKKNNGGKYGAIPLKKPD